MSECEHQWTDYGTLTSGNNPKLDIEACVRCGVQRKKQVTAEPNQLLLAIIDEQRKLQTPEQLVEFIIHLYGDELIKANDEIARLRINAQSDADVIEELRRLIEEQKKANDELFRIKQRVVAANREILQSNLEWTEIWQGSDDGEDWRDCESREGWTHTRRIRIKNK